MPAKKVTKTPETKIAKERRWTSELDFSIGDGLDNTAKTLMAAVRAAVYAVVPGKQTNKNIHELLEAGMKAAKRAVVRTRE